LQEHHVICAIQLSATYLSLIYYATATLGGIARGNGGGIAAVIAVEIAWSHRVRCPL